MAKKVNLYDIIWYMGGLLLYGFTSLIYMIIITRIIGVESAGKFTFAYAVAFTFFTVGVYLGKSFQITDQSGRYKDTDYIYNRIITCIAMIVLTIIFCLFKQYEFEKFLLIIILTLYRGADAFVDSIHAIIQKKDRTYKVGMSIFFRTLILIAGFTISLLMFKSVIISSIVIMAINILFFLIVDINIAKKNMSVGKFDIAKNNVLLIEGFLVFLFYFLAIYVNNASKYAIDSLSTDTIQGLFGIIYLPSSFVSLVSLYIVQPFLNNISELLKNKMVKELNKLLRKLTAIVTIIGLLIIIVAYFIGIPILNILYSVDLDSQRLNLIIILLGSVFYSIYSVYSQVLIAMRKNLYQVICLLVLFVGTILLCNQFVYLWGINGASNAYAITMGVELLLIYLGYKYFSNKMLKSSNSISIRLMGGLGNQMFEYAALRNMQLKNDCKAIIDLSGITNKTHNIYGLDHCNISKDVVITNKKSIKGLFSHLLYGFYWVFLSKKEKGFNFWKLLQPYLNSIGIYCVPDGYIPLADIEIENNYMEGYFQSINYIKENNDTIRDELQITDKLTGKNKKVYEEIQKNNSVCVHIRRGDYVGSFFEVCTKDYYLEAIKEMNKKVKNTHFYIFSDDINWAKENLGLKDVTYIDWKNNQYQDIKLMSGCKNFIMSNSSFSYWAQFLSNNKDKVVIAPSKWFKNGKKIDIYEDSWIKIKV
jgi:O-antigen/teichoic acid export membrane protein